MNASDRLNTCKSRGSMRVAILLMATGARVRNTYATYPALENNPEKSGLMLHSNKLRHLDIFKDSLIRDGHADD